MTHQIQAAAFSYIRFNTTILSTPSSLNAVSVRPQRSFSNSYSPVSPGKKRPASFPDVTGYNLYRVSEA